MCSGGIVGLGEGENDRAGLLMQLANLKQHPESVPINQLVRVEGTPLADEEEVEKFDFIRIIATARILMPKAAVRLSAGREEMSEEMQSMAFFAGANSIFYGEKLLTTANPSENQDMELMAKLGIKALIPEGANLESSNEEVASNPCPIHGDGHKLAVNTEAADAQQNEAEAV